MSALGHHRDSIQNLSALAHSEPEKYHDDSVLPKPSPLGSYPHHVEPTLTDSPVVQEEEIPISQLSPEQDQQQQQEEEQDQRLDTTTVPSVETPAYPTFDYDDTGYDYESYDPYALGYNPSQQKRGNLFQCFFSWFHKADSEEEEDDGYDFDHDHDDEQKQAKEQTNNDYSAREQTEEVKQQTSDTNLNSETSNDDDSSTGHYGKRLTSAERMAVVARLRLNVVPLSLSSPQQSMTDDPADSAPSNSNSTNSNSQSGDSAGGTLPSFPAAPKRGILKKSSSVRETPKPPERTTSTNGDTPESASRRSLFPSYDTPTTSSDKSKNKVHFSPMAKVVTVPSRYDMTHLFKSFIWWQRSDFDDFKKTARIIAKALLTGGSEIWLNASNSWSSAQQKKTTTIKHYSGMSNRQNEDYKKVMEKYESDTAYDNDAVGNKWWCQFGHSRRGLEHIVDMSEGRQRQRNVSLAISAVMEEQQRQKLNHKRDDTRLANVYSQYSSWARDLALAAGFADADGVKSDFGPQAKPRSYFLPSSSAAAWQMLHSQNRSSNANPHLSVNAITNALTHSDISPQILDANTYSHVMLKQKQLSEQRSRNHQNHYTTQQKHQHSQKKEDEEEQEQNNNNNQNPEMVHDVSKHHSCIAKKAAGFGVSAQDDLDASLLKRRTSSPKSELDQSMMRHGRLVANV